MSLVPPRHPAPFDAYVAPARARPQLWRLVAGLGLIAALNLVAGWTVIALLVGSVPRERLLPQTIGDTAPVMATLLLSFAGLVLGTWAAVRLLHRRGLASLIGHGPTALRHFLLGAGGVLAVHAALLALIGPQLGLSPNLAPQVWLAWLPLALAGVLLQTGAEELVFRGYLQQQVAARFATPLAWMILPSAAFGLLHHDPATMGGNTWMVVGLTGVFGLIAADLTARSGTLGLAWGLHFANNCFALLLVAPVGPLSGLALYNVPFGMDDTEVMRGLLLVDLVLLGLVWAVCRLALRRG